MRVLLDSHTVLWAAEGSDELPTAVAGLIGDLRNRVAVSVATIWELTLKAHAGRLRLPEAPAAYFDGVVRDFGYDLIPIHQRHVAALDELPAIHTDPFDRMLVAQAVAEDLELVTGDVTLRRYPIRTIW